MSLMKIRNEDLIFENKCFEDRINTELQLLDYDWMEDVQGLSIDEFINDLCEEKIEDRKGQVN